MAIKIKKVKTDKKSEQQTMLDRIEEDLARDNIIVPEYTDINQDYLTLPNELTDVTPRDLGEYLNAFTQQKIWIRTVIGRTEVVVSELQLKLDSEKIKLYADLPLKMSQKEKELYLLGNKETNKLVEDITFYTQKLKMLNDIIDSMEESIFVISREITRRKSDFDSENRSENSSWGKPLGRRK